jgi:hypothetical protein
VVGAPELSTSDNQPPRYRWLIAEAIGLLVLAAIAAYPRFIAPDLVPFGYDEALEALRARAIALGARPIANEVTSWLIPDPALMLYVYAAVEGYPDPAIARTWLLAVLNTVSVLLAYAWGRSVGGRRLGFGTALLYACSPWAIYFGRQPWVNAQPILTSLILLSATRVVQHRERRWSIPFFLALGLQMQTHLLGMVLVLPAVITVIAFLRAWGLTIIPGAVIVALINAPFAIHIWEQRNAVQTALGGGVPSQAAQAATVAVAPNMPRDALRLLAWFTGGWELEAKLVDGAQALSSLSQAQLLVGAIIIASLGVGVLLAIVQCIRRSAGWRGYAVALIWLLAPLAAAMAQNRPVYIHYMTALVPACFLLAALPFRTLFSVHRLLGALGLVVLIAIGSVQQLLFGALLQSVRIEASLPPAPVSAVERQARLNDAQRASRATGIGDLFGTPLSYWHEVAASVRRISAERDTNAITVYTGLSDPYELYVDRRRMALDYLLGNRITARFPFEGTVILPLEKSDLTMELPGVELPRAVRNPEQLLSVPVPGTRDDTQLISIPPRSLREQPAGRRSIRASFDVGVQLVSYDSPQRLEPGETLQLTTFWTFTELSRAVGDHDYSVFFHLLDEDGSIVAQSDGLGIPSSAWRSGDYLIRRVSLAIPTDRIDVRLTPVIGVYESANLRRVRVALAENKIDDRVMLNPISIR